MARWVCFNHGRESGPWGVKIRRLAAIAEAAGYEVMSPDYRGDDSLDGRLTRLLQSLPESYEELVLVGSSMGAHVAAAASAVHVPASMLLLAPAVYLPGYPTESLRPRAGRSLVVHGWCDEVVPVDHAIRFSREHSLPLMLVDSDHSLQSALDELCLQFSLLLGDAGSDE